MTNTPDKSELARCTCAEVEGENPDCALHGVSVEIWAAWTDTECDMEPEIDSCTVRRKCREYLSRASSRPPADQVPDMVDEAFAMLCRKYVQRADERQRGMGLQYTEAETHDLAKTIATFAALQAVPADLIQQQQATIERLSAALKDIANAQRLGAETDVLSWAYLANACQQAARTALGKDASDE